MKKFTYIFVVLVCFIFTGCSKTYLPPKVETTQKSKKDLNSLSKIAFYFDFSYSMQGYLDTSKDVSNFIQVVRNLELTSVSLPQINDFLYYKFDSELNNIESKNDIYNFKSYKNLGSYIDIPLDSMDTDNLNVLVTDLCQSSEDLVNVLQNLKKKLVKNENISLAFLCFKSQFNGLIDWGGIVNNIPYNTNDQDSSFRPFYVILIGNNDLITSFIKSFDQKYEGGFESLFFSNNLVNKLGVFDQSFENKEKIASKKIFSDDYKNIDTVILSLQEQDKICSIEKRIKLYKNDLQSRDYYSNSNLEFVTNCYTAFPNKNKDSLVENQSLLKTLNISDFKLLDTIIANNKAELNYRVKFNFKNIPDLKNSDIVVYKIQIFPKAYLFGSWVDNFNFNSSNLKTKTDIKTISEMIGPKTINLNDFIKGINDNFKSDKNKLAEFYIYLKIKS